MYSALVVVYTAYCALQIVRLTLHYITLHYITTTTLNHLWFSITADFVRLTYHYIIKVVNPQHVQIV